jgi:hypothetical protein
MESNSTIVEMNNDEKIYYEKVDEYINSLDKKSREKMCYQTTSLR